MVWKKCFKCSYVWMSSSSSEDKQPQPCPNCHKFDNQILAAPLVRLSALRLIKDCNIDIFGLLANGPSILAVKQIIERAERLHLIDIGNNNNTGELS